MRPNSRAWAGLAAFLLVAGAGGVASAQGKGGGGGGGGGNAGDAAGALYGDLYVIERDGAGAPITREVWYEDAETGSNIHADCAQPLAASCAKLPLWGEQEGFNPEDYDPCAVYTPYTDQIQEVKFGRESVSRAPAAVMDKSYAEALKGINAAVAGEGRCDPEQAIKLDPAGRLALCLASETEPVTYAWKTIDAPLENLGLYRAVMSSGCLGTVTEETVGEEGVRVVVTTALDPTGIYFLNRSLLGHLVCSYPGGSPIPVSIADALLQEDPVSGCTVTPDPVGGAADTPCWWERAITPDRTLPTYEPGDGVALEDMVSAAVFMAAGADKTSPVTLDEVVNVNNYLGVNLWTYTRVRKQQTLTIQYFPFAFEYERGRSTCVNPTTTALLVKDNGTFSIHPEANVFGTSPPGVDLRGDNGVAITVCRDGLPLAIQGVPVVCDAPLYNPPYDPAIGSYGCGGANWFAQAAEDARKTIWYLHNWRVPEIAY